MPKPTTEEEVIAFLSSGIKSREEIANYLKISVEEVDTIMSGIPGIGHTSIYSSVGQKFFIK